MHGKSNSVADFPILMVHGNGGGNSRFTRIRPLLEQPPYQHIRANFPVLPGFEGRPFPSSPPDPWQPFLQAFVSALPAAHSHWIYYGHGIGGSLLLEWAARGFPGAAPPRLLLLHAPIGASLEYRFFPKLMRPMPMRRFIHWLIYQPPLQAKWEKRLFLEPDRIPAALRKRFFQDYRHCSAFELFFDLITPAWYQSVLQRLPAQLPIAFWWGSAERVVAAEHLKYWQNDFPNASVQIIDGWDHFPMLETPKAFVEQLRRSLTSFLAEEV